MNHQSGQIRLFLCSEFHSYDFFLSKSRDIDIFELFLRCWRQFGFTKNLEKFSAKILIPLLLKCSLLSFKCSLGSMLSSCERNEISLSSHISTRRRFTSFALLCKSPSLRTMPDTVTVFINDVARSIVAYAIWLGVFSVLKSFVLACRTIWSGFISRKVCLTWSVIKLIFAPENECTLTRCLYLIFLVSR